MNGVMGVIHRLTAEIERLREREAVMRRLLQFYAQDDFVNGVDGYNQVFNMEAKHPNEHTVFRGVVIEDAGARAQLLLLDFFGELGLWKDAETKRKRLARVSYTELPENKIEEDEEDEDDGQPDEAREWRDMDPDC